MDLDRFRKLAPCAPSTRWQQFLANAETWASVPSGLESPLLEKAMNVLDRINTWHRDVYEARLHEERRRIDQEEALATALAEKARALAEKERAQAEKERAQAEKERAQAEKERAQAEKERAQAEKVRALAEKDQALAAAAAREAEMAEAKAQAEAQIAQLLAQLRARGIEP